MELFILLLLIMVVAFIYRKLSSVVYSIVIIDILLRIIDFIKNNISSTELFQFLNKNVPISIPSIINKYTEGLLTEVLMWALVIVYIIFEYYIIMTFVKKKK